MNLNKSVKKKKDKLNAPHPKTKPSFERAREYIGPAAMSMIWEEFNSVEYDVISIGNIL